MRERLEPWRGWGGGHVGWEEGARAVAGCLLINSCNFFFFLKPHLMGSTPREHKCP